MRNLFAEISELESKTIKVSTATPATKVEKAEKTFRSIDSFLKDSGLKLDYTNPSMSWDFKVKGSQETFTLKIMDGWITVDLGNSSVGSAINDKNGYARLLEFIKKK